MLPVPSTTLLASPQFKTLKNMRISIHDNSMYRRNGPETAMIRNRDSRSMIEFTKRFLEVAMRTCLNPISSASVKRENIVEPRMSYKRCVENKLFAKLTKILNSTRYNLQFWLPNGGLVGEGPSALHILLHNNPPIEVVGTLLCRMKTMNPEFTPEMHQDQKGMTPLHVAIVNFCDARVIEHLIFGNCIPGKWTSSAAIADCHQRYPLHYICSNRTRVKPNMRGKNGRSLEDTVRIIRWLVVSYPDAVNSEDVNGWTPIQMAEKLDADRQILELLRNAKVHSLLNEKAKCDSSDLTPTSNTSGTSAFDLGFEEVWCALPEGNLADDISSVGWNAGQSKSKLTYQAKSNNNQRVGGACQYYDSTKVNENVLHQFRFI